jgi:secreted trypsin-like serine protease
MRRPTRLFLPATLAALALIVPATAIAQSGGSAEPRIVGGNTASVSTYPWQAAVTISPSKAAGNAHNRQFCGGSLITSRIVITAGHCVADTDPDCALVCNSEAPICTPLSDPSPGDGTCKLDPDDVDVVLGRTTLSDTSQGAEFGVQAVKLGTNFNGSYGTGVPRFDAAYLVLSAPANGLTPIKIAGTDEGALWDTDSPEDISGWGTTSGAVFASTQDTLRAATVQVLPDPSCSSAYSTDYDAGTMLCAGLPGGGVDTCSGDSGGPLEAALQGGGYRLVGLTGWGEGCAQAASPGVYTRVAAPAMRSLIASDVSTLETANGLPDESVFGSGGQPRSATPTAPGTKRAKALRKCKRIRSKRKRHRCVKRVKAGTRAQHPA